MGAAVLLVVAAAFAHAGWNFFAKRAGSGGAAFVWLTAACSALLYLPLAALSLVLTAAPPLSVGLLGVVVSATLHLGYSLLLQRGYAVGDMSVVYPLARGTGPLLAVLFAVLLFGERPGVLGLIRAAAVVLGVLVISSGGSRSAGSRALSIGYGVATGATIAVYTLW